MTDAEKEIMAQKGLAYAEGFNDGNIEGYHEGEIETKGALAEILAKAEKLHPYKEIGNIESYSDYNQGWVSALEYVADQLDIDF